MMDCHYKAMPSGKVDYSSHYPELSTTFSSSFEDPELIVEERRKLLDRLPNVSLAKLSVIILVVASCTDMMLTYDTPKSRPSLGSAAILSVTAKLAPILPFTGGLDLRREDYWSNNNETWFGNLQSAYTKVQNAYSKSDSSPQPSSTSTAKRSQADYVPAISTTEPFVKTAAIAELTLGEIAEVFRWSVRSSNADFNEARYMQKLHPRVKKVLQKTKAALARSRGSYIEDWTRLPSDAADGIDVLKFSAAMRIFAEWRVIRLVPPGYKGFAVGLSLGHKDVVQNIVKIEESVHRYFAHYENDNAPLCTPTIGALLKWEIETGVQSRKRLPRLTEKSSGMGLLWVRRQLAYQSRLFDNVREADRFASPKDAVAGAYKDTYDKYHGWAVQKIFNYSFQASPDMYLIIEHMNPRLLEKLTAKEPSSLSSNQSHFDKIHSDTESKEENPLEQLMNHIGGEWDKFADGVIRIFNKKHVGTQPPNGSAASSDSHIRRGMILDAHEQISAFLEVSYPILETLEALFKDLNMEDPTRV